LPLGTIALGLAALFEGGNALFDAVLAALDAGVFALGFKEGGLVGVGVGVGVGITSANILIALALFP